jgi:phosphotransacetylase
MLIVRGNGRMSSLPTFDELQRHADRRQRPVSVAVAGGADVTVLEALHAAQRRGWVDPWLVGPAAEVERLAAAGGINLKPFHLVDSDTPAAAAVELVRSGQAELLMKGQIATPALMKAVLDPDLGLRTDHVICQIVLMELTHTRRTFLLADTGICIQPTLEQKLDILNSTVEVAQALGVDESKVAVLAASESVTAAMPETLDAAELQRRNEAGLIPKCQVIGPVSFDMAFDPAAAAKKGHSDARPADILLFPNLLSANLTVKAIMYTAECRFGGVLRGARCPVVFMSRADSTETRLNSLALALRLLD